MKKTENFNLNQWEPHDEIKVEDFNADNAVVDAALNNLTTEVAGCGNCKIATGTYVGTGTYGISSPVTITLEFPPKVMWIYCENYNSGAFVMSGNYYSAPTDNSIQCFLKGGSSIASHVYVTGSGQRNTNLYYTMENNTFSCYNTLDATVQMNAEGTTYHYIAIG